MHRHPLAALLALAACAPAPSADRGDSAATDARIPDEAGYPAPVTVVNTVGYRCTDGPDIVARYQSDQTVRLELPDGERTLPAATSASGARYAEAGVEFWTRGPEGRLKTAAGEFACAENSWVAQVAGLREAGAEYVARGNEPGWRVVVWPDSIVLVDNYGQDTVRFPGAVPEVEGNATLWSTTAGEKRFNLSISEVACNDDMSGEPFPLTARYLHGVATRVGCGQKLQ